MDKTNEWKRNAIFVGAIVGAVVGVIAAQQIIKEAEEKQEDSALTTTKGFKLGAMVLSFLRNLQKL